MPLFRSNLGNFTFFAFICLFFLVINRFIPAGTSPSVQTTILRHRDEENRLYSLLAKLISSLPAPVTSTVSEVVAKKPCRESRSYEIFESSLGQHQTGWIKSSAAQIAEQWDKVLPHSDKRPDICGKSAEDLAFVRAIFRAKFVAHAQPCASIMKVGGKKWLNDDGSDGSKFICTANVSKGNCVVYSLGSRKDFSFEAEIVAKLQCKVHTFDCTVGDVSPDEVPHGVIFHPWCIGGENALKPYSSDLLVSKGNVAQYYTIRTVMFMLGHSYVDILKMDIERHEFAVIKTMACPGCFGQAAIELHLHNAYGMFGQAVTYEEWNDVWDSLVCDNGLHPFSYDTSACKCCCEYSFLGQTPE